MDKSSQEQRQHTVGVGMHRKPLQEQRHHIIGVSRQLLWAAWYNFWLLVKLTPKGVSFLFCGEAA